MDFTVSFPILSINLCIFSYRIVALNQELSRYKVTKSFTHWVNKNLTMLATILEVTTIYQMILQGLAQSKTEQMPVRLIIHLVNQKCSMKRTV